VCGADTAILHRSSLRVRKRRKIRKGEPPLSPPNLKDRQEEPNWLEDLREDRKQHNLLPKDEDVHRRSQFHTFTPSFSEVSFTAPRQQ